MRQSTPCVFNNELDKNKKHKNQFMKKFFSFLALSFFLAMPLVTLAQPGGDDDVVDVPIDGGISFLLIAGAGYGAKKLYALKDQKQAPEL